MVVLMSIVPSVHRYIAESGALELHRVQEGGAPFSLLFSVRWRPEHRRIARVAKRPAPDVKDGAYTYRLHPDVSGEHALLLFAGHVALLPLGSELRVTRRVEPAL